MWRAHHAWSGGQVTLLDRPTAVPEQATTPPPHTRVGFVLRQLVLLAVAAATYFGVRSLTVGDAATATSNAHDLVALERSLGIFVEQQAQSFAMDLPGLMTVVNAIYIYGHWPVIGAVFVWLAWRRPDAYPVYRNALLISGLVGMAIVAFYPVAPPRLMDLGFLDTVTTQTNAYRVLQPPAFTNPYAAMPSFHVGWDLLVGIALVRESGHAWVRMAGRVLPLLMVAAVVLTGNHYFLDAVAGDTIVLASLAVATWWSMRRRQDGITICWNAQRLQSGSVR
ncbi:hypothetical protein ASD66_13985 [Nocardioides sp. Root151]|nr:hypothetical protein ASD66_13985 [Nocardioides sp. Root151]